MQNVYNKHGEAVFEFRILEDGFDPKDKKLLTRAEQAWADKLKPVYNSRLIVESCYGMKLSAETRAKMSKSAMGNTHGFQKGRDSWRGRKMSAETKAKISATKKGCAGPRPGIPRTEEVKKKISLAKMGVPKTEEFKRKVSATMKGRPWSEARRAAYKRSCSAAAQET